MVYRQKFIIKIALVVCVVANMSGYSETLIDTRNHIQKHYIETTTAEVVKKAHKDRSIEKEFKKYLEEDKMMRKIEQIDKDGTDEIAIDVVKFSEHVQEDFAEKGKELINDLEWAAQLQLLSKEMVAFGLCGVVGGIAMKQYVVAGAAGLVTIGGSYGWYSNNQKMKSLPVHIKAVHTMEANWNDSFVIIKNEKK